MSGDVHVQFCERLWGKFLRATLRVLMAKRMPQSALDYLNKLLKRMKLKLNEDKSKIVNAFDENFDFLGHTFRLDDDLFGRKIRRYWNVEPSSKSQKKVREKIREYLRHNGHKPPQDVANDLNTITRGWINYFSIKGVTYPNKAKRNLTVLSQREIDEIL